MRKIIGTLFIAICVGGLLYWHGPIQDPAPAPPIDQAMSVPVPAPAPVPLPEPPSVMKLSAAGQDGNATVQIVGLDVSRMQVTITSGHDMRITIPVGTPFNSAAGETQNMIAARTTQIEVVAGETRTAEIEVYCVNRFKDAPTKDSTFTASDAVEDSPLTRLSACLDQKGADHNTRQLAIWLVSDGLKDKPRDEVVQEFVKHTDDELLSQGQNHLDFVLALAHESGRFTDDDLKAMQDKYSTPEKKDEVDQMFKSAIEENVKQYGDLGGPLLTQCGYDTESLPFFQGR